MVQKRSNLAILREEQSKVTSIEKKSHHYPSKSPANKIDLISLPRSKINGWCIDYCGVHIFMLYNHPIDVRFVHVSEKRK